MKSSYKEKDVILLLKDISGMIQPTPTEEREIQIQKGIHYSEMLPLEYEPTEEYMKLYKIALENYSKETAIAVANVAEKIFFKKGKNVVLVSLARAGIPIGILIKHYLEKKYKIEDIKHYSISIIRGKEIDYNALNYILKRHSATFLQFVDGWIGKGAILEELKKSLIKFDEIDTELAVLSDPAGLTKLYGTREDILIPSSCLNSTVCGLISRTFLRKDIIQEKDFHGAVYYSNLISQDVSYEFINKVEKYFEFDLKMKMKDENKKNSREEIKKIANFYKIEDINFIKPGIGETTRVLLRRIPWKILVNKKYKNEKLLQHLFRLAQEKNVSIEFYPLENYKVCGIIKKYSDI